MTPFKPFARLVFALVLSITLSAALLPRPIAAQQTAKPVAKFDVDISDTVFRKPTTVDKVNAN